MFAFFNKHRTLSVIITISIALFIFVMSSLPEEKITQGVGMPILSWQATTYHFLVFFLFTFFLIFSLAKNSKKIFILVAVLIAVFYGITDEVHQFFVPGRFCTFSDVVIDSAGSLFAVLIYSLKFLNNKFIK